MRVEGKRPRRLGVDGNGRLRPCPSTPNCVCSQNPPGRGAIAPLAFQQSPERAMEALRGVVEGLARTRVIRASRDYLYAEVRSRLFGFVDDLEFHCDRRQRLIHVRSASRVGYSDLGVNRRRVEAIRKDFAKAGG